MKTTAVTVEDLRRSVLAVPPLARRVISGIGERPAITHWTRFGLRAFTSGAVCIAPALSTAILRALQAGDIATAGTIRSQFLPFEDLRDAHSPLRVLH